VVGKVGTAELPEGGEGIESEKGGKKSPGYADKRKKGRRINIKRGGKRKKICPARRKGPTKKRCVKPLTRGKITLEKEVGGKKNLGKKTNAFQKRKG